MKISPKSALRRSLMADAKRDEMRLLSEAIQIEEEVAPAFVRKGLVLVGLLVLAFLVWASVVEVKEVAATKGEIVPAGSVKTVQHPEGGTVADILVKEGQVVEHDQVLLRLDEVQAGAELKQLQSRAVALRLREERLSAFAHERQPNFEAVADGHFDLLADQRQIYTNQILARQTALSVVEAQIEQRKKRVSQLEDSLKVARQQQALAAEMLATREKLVEKRLVTQVVLMESRKAKIAADGEVARLGEEIGVSRQELAEAEMRRRDASAKLRQDALAELGAIGAELAEVRTSLERARTRFQRLELRAPVRGMVQDLRVVNRAQVVQPGSTILQIVPLEAGLEAEVRLSTRDIGHVEVGAPVVVKVASYDFQRFGGVEGRLRQVSATSLVDKDGQPYFRAWVTLSQLHVGDQPGRFPVLPGMSVEADIVTGEKTLIAYLLKPVRYAFDSSFRER